MSRDAADQILAGLGAAHDRIAAAMYALDTHPALGFLRGGTLAGATATRWRTLSPEIDLLWSHFTVLGGSLDRARVIRGARRPDDPQWTELTALLREAAVGLDSAGMSADTSGSPPVAWVRLWDLAQDLEKRSAAATAYLSEVDAARSLVANRLAPVTESVDALARLATELCVASSVEHLRPRLAELYQLDLADPLSAVSGGRLGAAADARLSGLDAAVTEARKRLAGLARLRDGYQQRIAALHGLADELSAAERVAAAAYDRAIEKIVEPGLAPIPTGGPTVHTTAAELERLGRDAKWAELADRLELAERSAQQARDRTDQLRDLAEGLLARRDELRGRLDAYRAKAAAKGLGEDSQLSTCYDQAHTLLFTAPCDLRGATRAVLAYQRTLASLSEESAS